MIGSPESESSFGFAASATSSGAADFAGGPPEFSDAAGFVGAVALGLGAGTSGFFGFVCKASNTHTKRNSTFSRRNSCGVHRIEPYRSCIPALCASIAPGASVDGAVGHPLLQRGTWARMRLVLTG